MQMQILWPRMDIYEINKAIGRHITADFCLRSVARWNGLVRLSNEHA